MKPLLAILAGFAVSLSLFVGGMGFAAFLLFDEPAREVAAKTQNVAELWTTAPRRVEPARQNLERVAPEPEAGPDGGPDGGKDKPAVTMASTGPAEDAKRTDGPAAPADPGDEDLDATVTGAIPSFSDPYEAEGRETPDAAASELAAAHMEWCAGQYRSYRPETNTYTSYSGGERECVSPLLEEAGGLDTGPVNDESTPSVIRHYASTASGDGGALSADHIRSCFERYRSYRPEDNTYQPYGGGPRRQCD